MLKLSFITHQKPLPTPQYKEATRHGDRVQWGHPGAAEGTELKEKGSDMQSEAEAAWKEDNLDSPGSRGSFSDLPLTKLFES